MTALLAALLLSAAPEVTPAAAAGRLADAPTGTLLMSHGACVYVKAYTGSRWTHVGVLVREAGGPVVYDSMKGVGVRSLPLAEYLAAQEGAEVRALRPREPLGGREAALTSALRAELGRPYGVSHFLTGREAEGLHCSEYASGALSACGLIEVTKPGDVSPGSLFTGLTRHRIYEAGERFEVAAAEPTPPPGMNACEECWWETKQCCKDFGRGVTGWLLCW